MSSGCVVGTISTTICGPALASNAANLATRRALSAADNVPVWSITRSLSGGTGSRSWAHAVAPRKDSRSSSASCRRRSMATRPAYFEAAGAAGAALSKLTEGGTLIWASLATAKFSLTL